MLKVHSNADCKFLSDDRGFLPSNKTAAVVDFGHCGKTTRDRKKNILLRKKSKSIAFSPRSEEKSENDRCRSDNKVRAGKSYYDDC